MYKQLNFEKPKKLRSTEEHNDMHTADCMVAGVYVPNMSDEDNRRWKCKHISGKSQRIEIRRFVGGANIVIKIFKSGTMKLSANSTINMNSKELSEFLEIIQEAKDYLSK